MSAPTGDGVPAQIRRRRAAALRLPGLDDLDTRDPLDRLTRTPPRVLWVGLRHDEHRAVLSTTDRPGLAGLLVRLDVPQLWNPTRRGYVGDLVEGDDVEALAVHERWVVRYRKPRPAVVT